jgi:hypothetical protein
MQSHQDDNYEALETFAETTYIFLTLKAIQQRISEDELYLLDPAAKVAVLVQPDLHQAAEVEYRFLGARPRY